MHRAKASFIYAPEQPHKKLSSELYSLTPRASFMHTALLHTRDPLHMHSLLHAPPHTHSLLHAPALLHTRHPPHTPVLLHTSFTPLQPTTNGTALGHWKLPEKRGKSHLRAQSNPPHTQSTPPPNQLGGLALALWKSLRLITMTSWLSWSLSRLRDSS